MHKLFLLIFLSVLTCSNVWGCTSAIVSARASASGRPLLWKHRDTGTFQNFIGRVKADSPDQLNFIALFNAGDSLMEQAWIGMNEAGFAIMNTASYNLAPDTASLRDREGYIMAQALSTCRNSTDFEHMLSSLPKPLGVQANFGVIDANGNGAYYETDDYTFTRFPLEDSDSGVLIRTNFSFSGQHGPGLGRVRYDNARHLIQPYVKNHTISPYILTERLSRSFYHSGRRHDALADSSLRHIKDLDFIPRRSTSASIVIEGVRPGEDPALTVMWTVPGYPPCSCVVPVTLTDSIPEELQPDATGLSPAWRHNATLRDKAITKCDSTYYVDLDYIRKIDPIMRKKSADTYRRHSKKSKP